MSPAVQSRSSSPAVRAPVKLSGNNVMVDSLVEPPGRHSRPPRLAVILRGLPGAGKSHLAKLLKEKEVEHGSEPPRTLALDDYFECDGEYEYEAEMEAVYRSNLEKSFKKNIDGGYFPFLIVDAINEKVEHFSGMWSHAKQNGFEVYVCEVEVEVSVAADRNLHGRTGKEVVQLSKAWEATPSHMNTLDVRALLQDDAIQHVDMEEDPPEEDKKSDNEVVELDNEDSEGDNSQEASFLSASKWDVLDSGERMAKLDGTTDKVKSKLAQHTSIEDWLELGDNYNKPVQVGKKRVRWADIEEKKSRARADKMGFVVGGRNWESASERERSAQGALERTKFIPSRFQSEFHR